MKREIMLSFLFCWCISSAYGQVTFTDTSGIYPDSDVSASTSIFDFPNPNVIELVELYEEYETQCFNDSTKQCFNYYSYDSYPWLQLKGKYKTPCNKWDMDLGIDGNYTGTGEEWIHVQPNFIGFMQYLKDRI